MPSINEAAAITNLLNSRAGIIKFIRDVFGMESLRIFVTNNVEEEPEVVDTPSEFMGLFGWKARHTAEPKQGIHFLDGDDKAIQSFLLIYLRDKLADVDMQLLDAGFDFPDGYADELKKYENKMLRFKVPTRSHGQVRFKKDDNESEVIIKFGPNGNKEDFLNLVEEQGESPTGCLGCQGTDGSCTICGGKGYLA